MKLLNLFLSLLVSAVMAALVLEGGLRLIGMGPPKTLNSFDAHTGWKNKPGETITRKTVEGFSVTYAFNEHGMRDDADLQPQKPAGTTRILALGDSFTLGLTVSRDDLYVDLLERWWHDEGRPVQVVNTGTEAFSTDQEVAWLLAHGESWSPDIVLLAPYENDVYWNGQTSYTSLDKPRFTADGKLEDRALEDHMHRGFLARTALGRLLGAGRPDPPRTFELGGRRLLEEFGVLVTPAPEFLADPIARTRGALKALKAECDRLGAQLLVTPIPSHSAVDPEFRQSFEQRLGLAGTSWSPDQPVDVFLDAARAEGIETLDVRPVFRERTTAGTDLFFFRDWHINPEGNRVYAELLHQKLDQLGVLPAPTGEARIQSAAAVPSGTGRIWPYVFLTLWAVLGTCFSVVYKREERFPLGFLKVGALLAVVFTIALSGGWLLGMLPPAAARLMGIVLVLTILGFVVYKLGDRVTTITELISAFVGRGHWYLLPLVTVLLTIGSLLVVAASSPLVAPFIYTLF